MRRSLVPFVALLLAIIACSPADPGHPPYDLHRLQVTFLNNAVLGTVTFSPPDALCPDACQNDYPAGTVVTLVAQPRSDARFDGWSDACSGTAATCTVTLSDADRIAVVAFSIPLPRTPTNVNVSVAAAGGEAVASWDPMPETAEFVLYLASEPGVTPANYASLAEGQRLGPYPNPVNLSGLVDGRRYYLVIAGQNLAGEGPPSAEVSFVFLGVPTARLPPAPTNVQVAPGTAQAVASWDAMAETSQFILYLASAPGVTPANYASLAEGQRLGPYPNPVNLAGLVDGRRYYLVVAGTNTAGEGPPSAEVSFIFGTPPDPHFGWAYATGCPIYYSSPAVGPDGTVYFGTGSPTAAAGSERGVFALNADGTLKWKNVLGVTMYSPAVAADGLYVQDANSTLYKLSLTDGTKLWEYPLSAQSNVGQASPAIDDPAEDAVYVVAEVLYALHADGTLKWKFPASSSNGAIRSSPAVAADGTIYVGVPGPIFDGATFGAALYALNRDGSVKWTTVLAGMGYVFSSPAIGSDGTVYLGAETGSGPGATSALYAVAANGTISWRHEVPAGSGPIRSSPAIAADGTVYVGLKAGSTSSGQLIALSPTLGALLWSYPVEGGANDVYSSPTVGADGLVYFGSESQRLYALDPSGTLVWSFDTKNGINWTSPAITADGTLYIGNNDGKLFSLHTTSLGLAPSPWPKFRRNLAATGR